jgi:hypothetical protein
MIGGGLGLQDVCFGSAIPKILPFGAESGTLSLSASLFQRFFSGVVSRFTSLRLVAAWSPTQERRDL